MLPSLSAFLSHAFGQAKSVNRASTMSMPVPKGLVLPRKVYFVNACIPELRSQQVLASGIWRTSIPSLPFTSTPSSIPHSRQPETYPGGEQTSQHDTYRHEDEVEEKSAMLYSTIGNDLPPSAPTRRITRSIEPGSHQRPERPTALLQERLSRLWGCKQTYETICSTRFSNTISDLFSTSVMQIAENDELVRAALYSFCAADSTIKTDQHQSVRFQIFARLKVSRAFRLLAEQLNGWPTDLNKSFMAIMSAVFLMAAYGICADEPEVIEFMTNILSRGRSRSAAFPLALKFQRLENKGWRLRIFMADDPSDTGLVCGHDTSIFDVARDKFTKSAVHESLVQEL